MAVAVKSTAPANPRYFTPGTAFARVLQEAPFLARCSDDKTATRVRPREYSVCYPYMQINRPGMVSWLIFDLDHANALVWDDAGLPPPNLVVRNRVNGHSHLYYAIVPVCTSEAGRNAPIAYMKAVYEAMALRLQADLQYHGGPVAKTPGHPWWDTLENHDQVYDLGELAEHLDLVVKPWGSKGPQLDDASHSRHCILFEQLRFYAYGIVSAERDEGTFDSFVRRLEAFAYNHNDFKAYGFADKLPMSSLRATVRSISRWTWNKYTGASRCHRGAMALDNSLPLPERQSLAAKRTHGLRQKATESRIRAACRGLLDKGARLTFVAVAAVAGLARQTVAGYRHILEEVLNPAPVVVALVAAAGAAVGVTYGAHQIPALGEPVGPPALLLPGDGPPDP